MNDKPEVFFSQDQATDLKSTLAVMAEALAGLERHLRPQGSQAPELSLEQSLAYVWEPKFNQLRAIPRVQRVPLKLLLGIEQVRDTLLENTKRFAEGLPANNALLWGARGTGKSSIVKAIHHELTQGLDPKSSSVALLLVEIQRDDIGTVDQLLHVFRGRRERVLLFCDDLSFDQDDSSYKALKAILDGGVEGRPENVLLYATSNRRHLLPRDMIENEQATGVHPGEAVEEKLSLSDRFGLWLGFHRCDQTTYLEMVEAYCQHFGLNQDENLVFEAKQWATIRGSRSGRVAWQFIQDWAGRQGKTLTLD